MSIPQEEITPIFRISDLCALLEGYMEPDQIKEVYRAYLFGAEAHDGQHRVSGEAYITHPLEAAKVLAEMHMDHKCIMAAILHDVIEDTSTAKETLEDIFGEEIAELVDGVSKIAKIDFATRAEAQAENLRKMMLAMVRDIRVILIKLADRLHNMRTLGVMPPEKRRRIAHETLEIYAPIASRLGMNTIRLELEDLGFAAMYPDRYRILKDAVIKARGNRKEIVHKIEIGIKRRLRQEELNGSAFGREKHLYSIYMKMKHKSLSFHEVFDMYAFRIIVDKVDTCYRVLGAMHSLYKPVPGYFKDYIAIPKANGYQSLHTILFGPYGAPIEVQIRTEDMHALAEAGIAAHWLYKSGDSKSTTAETRAREWLRGLLELQKNAGNSLEFIENVKLDLFPDEIYVFTPKGEIMELPRGATSVDFAYAVHTDVGNTCVASRINRKLSPLRTPLHTGQTVEVIDASGAKPNPAWLNFVVTAKARTNIRHYLKNLQQEEAIHLGKRLFEKALMPLNYDLDKISENDMDALCKEHKYKNRDALYEDIGIGNRMAALIARKVVPVERGQAENAAVVTQDSGASPLVIKGTEGMVVNFAKCCYPIPGDSIIGFISTGRGIVIHTEICKNIAEFRKKPEKWLDVEWEPKLEGNYTAEVRVEVANQRGVLATVASIMSELDCNIENVDIEERDGLTSSMVFIITVKNRQHLAQVMRRIRSIKSVMRISRKKS